MQSLCYESYVHVGLQKLIPTSWQAFGSQNELQTGQLEPGKKAILRQRSARIGFRVGFGGQQVKGRAHVEISWCFVARKTLFCRVWQPFGRCTVGSKLPTTFRPEARRREGRG